MERPLRLFAPARVAALVLCIAAVTPATASAQRGRQGRPELPDEQTAGTEHFLIHYTFFSEDAVQKTDEDGNTVPDYVDAMGAALEYSWGREVVDMGWAAPPNDEGEGSDNRIDVYLENDMAHDIAGYTESQSGQVGDNPNTPEIEQSAAYSFLSIDNDFAEADLPPSETPMDLMKVTVAHEFNHVLQAGYDSTDPETWIYEGTAAWMEGQVYPDIADALYYLPDLLDHPESCLATKKLWYGSWLYMEYLSEQYGPDMVRAIWEHSRGVDGFQAIDDALAGSQTSLADTSRDFAVANLLRAYKNGDTYPTVHLGGRIDEPGTFAPKTMVSSLGASYVQLGGHGALSIRFAGKGGLSARVVGVQGGKADIFDFADGAAVIDLGNYDEAYVVVHSDQPASVGNRCGTNDYALTVSAAKGASSPIAATWPAPDFDPPTTVMASGSNVTPNLHQPYRGEDAVSPQSPEGLKPGFTTIIPAPPDGYYFDYAYVMTRKDFGSSAPYYVPDADKSANYDYLNGDGTRLTISEAPTDFVSLQDWENDIQYTPDSNPQPINGVEVLIEDTSTQARDQMTATLIYRGLFIVVEGDAPLDDITAMVLALLEKNEATTPNAQGGTQGAATQLGTATPDAPDSTAADKNTTNLIIFGAGTACIMGLCFAGIGVVAVVFLMRGRGRRG